MVDQQWCFQDDPDRGVATGVTGGCEDSGRPAVAQKPDLDGTAGRTSSPQPTPVQLRRDCISAGKMREGGGVGAVRTSREASREPPAL